MSEGTATAETKETVQKSAAERVLDTMDEVTKTVTKTRERIDAIEKTFEELKKPQGGNPYAVGPGTRVGESMLSSRPYSLMRLCTAIRARDFSHAKVEVDLSRRLQAASGHGPDFGYLIPFSTYHMPIVDSEDTDGKEIKGYPVALVAEVKQLMSNNVYVTDDDELEYLSRRGFGMIQKDLSADQATSGGTLVSLPTQGELIDLLRPMEIFSRAGAQEITLPPGGSIRFPRDTSDPTIAAYGEGATITESTPGTGELTLTAKRYSGLVDVPLELFKFATSVSVEAWLRNKFVLRLAIQTDADMVNGAGGTAIKGVITYSAINTVTATTTGGNGDTIGPNDPSNMLAEIENQNARGLRMFFALRPRTWNRVTHRRADAVSAADAAGPYLFDFSRGTGPNPDTLAGQSVIRSTNVPNNRTKGSGTNLTIVLAGVGPSWIIARSGVAEVDMTTSDASKFASGLNTMRGTVFMDAGPEHEEEFAFIDSLLENT